MASFRLWGHEAFIESVHPLGVRQVSYQRHNDIDREIYFFWLHIVISNVRKHDEQRRQLREGRN